MIKNISQIFACLTITLALSACGNGSNSSTSSSASNTTNLGGIQSGTPTPAWVIEAYNQLFPNNPLGYTAQSLSDALAAHNVFSNQNTVQQVYNLAGFLANAAHETGNFQYMTELGNYNPGSASNWSTDGKGNFTGSYAGCQAPYGGTGNTCYYGRGALQISHDYNYRVYGSTNGTFTNPDLILGSGAPNYLNNLLFDSGVWFWSDDSTDLQAVRPIDGFKANADTYAATDPFGQSIKVINGAIECGSSASSVAISERNDRISRFINYLPVIAKAANVQLIPGYSLASDGTIGVACTSGPASAAFTMQIQNTGSTYASVILQAPDYSAYYYVGAGNTSIAPGATVTVGTTAAKLPNTSSGLNSAFPITAISVAIPRISIGKYNGNVDVTSTNPTNGPAGTICISPPAATFLPNTKASIVINGDTGVCTLTNPN